MKRIWKSVCLILMLAMLAGCGVSEPEETAAPVETAAAAEASGEPTVETDEPAAEITEAPTEAPTEETAVPETEPESLPGEVCNTDVLNVRKAPGVGSELVTTLKRGTPVRVYEQTEKDGRLWGRIGEGWVCMDYIRLEGETPESTEAPDQPAGTPSEPEETNPEPHVHTWQDVVTPPTCTDRGYTTHTCQTCGKTEKDGYTDPNGHAWGSWETKKEPSETSAGRAVRTCSGCGRSEERVLEKLPANHTHSYSEKVTRAATCARAGENTFTCTCGDTYTEEIPRTAHSYASETVKPTCTARGYTVYTCKNCGASYRDSYTNSVPHDYRCEETPPTCDFDGKKVYTCSVCAQSYTLTTPRTGHDYKTAEKKPTCTESGSRTTTCGRCGDTATETVPAAGHKWSSWVTEKKPTETSAGLKARTCSSCGKRETQTIDKLPAEPKPTEPKPTEPKPTEPAPTEPKPTEPTKPGVCEHKFDYVHTEPPTCGSSGLILRYCSLCGYCKQEAGDPPLMHNYVLSAHADPTCTADGFDTWTCTKCGDSGTDILPASHNWEHHYEGEVGHWVSTIHCHCGWSCSGDGDWLAAYRAHCPDDWYLHSYYDTAEWIVDIPGTAWEECTVCGAVK